MSLLSRLLGNSPPATETSTTSAPPAPVEAPRPDPAVRAREEEASVSQAIAAGDLASVSQWVLQGSTTRIRQMAAHAVTDLEQLRELIRATRGGKDKTVHRILADKRDELLAEMRAAQKLQADLETTAADIALHSQRPYDALYSSTLERLEAQWHALEPHSPETLRDSVARQLERAREVVDEHRRAIEVEAERKRSAALAAEESRRQRELEARAAVEAAAEAAAEQARAREVERQAELARQEAETAEVRHLLGLLRQAQAALDQGGTARAARLRDAIEERLPGAPALPPWFARKLQEVASRIEELKDWKTFRVVPKRAELVERMQSLVGADMSPEELARQIRRLRDEWRTLNRGAAEDPSPEWQAFDDAATRAYEPCREHFAQQAERRRENQAHREAMLDRLSAFAAQQAGEDVNWRAVQQAIVESRREWQQYAPVDQAAARPLQERFRAVLQDLQGRLDAEHARNVQAKRELIARTAALADVKDTRQAIEEAKSLQRTWKTIGLVPRQQDNQLWEEFRRHCDAVFERSAQEWAAHGASLDANQARAIALCEELERLAGSADEAPPSDRPPLGEVRAEFDSLELPRASARELRGRFADAVTRYGEAARRHRAEAERRAWSDLFGVGSRLNEYALAVAQGRSPEDCAAFREAAASAVAGLAHAPKGTRAILEQQMARTAAGAIGTDLAANESARRMLCVRAELIAGVPTPPEDLELRREYQMQRLVAAMGRGERPAPADLDALALEWIAAGPVETVVHDALLARLERCRGTLGGAA